MEVALFIYNHPIFASCTVTVITHLAVVDRLCRCVQTWKWDVSPVSDRQEKLRALLYKIKWTNNLHTQALRT